MENIISDTINELFIKYGLDILQEGDRFCAIVGDMAPNLKTEIKVLRRMNQENILEEIYQVLLKEKAYDKRDIGRIQTLLISSGFSDDWIKIALEAFGLEGKALQGLSAADSVKSMESSGKRKQTEQFSSYQDMKIEKGVLHTYTGQRKIVIVPEGVQEIHWCTFMSCRALETIKIPNSVVKIGKGAFASCPNLQTIEFGERLEVIDEYAFSRCSTLETIKIPNSVVKIGKAAFSCCPNLQTIELGERLEVIDKYAFLSCSTLETIKIPNSVVKIGSGAFVNCPNLQTIELGERLEVIEYKAFEGCRALESIKLPDSVVKIEAYAFKKCYSLESIELGEGLKMIDENAFSGCERLHTIQMPDTLPGGIMFDVIFESPNLKIIKIPKQEKIKYGAKKNSVLKRLMKIVHSV